MYRRDAIIYYQPAAMPIEEALFYYTPTAGGTAAYSPADETLFHTGWQRAGYI